MELLLLANWAQEASGSRGKDVFFRRVRDYQAQVLALNGAQVATNTMISTAAADQFLAMLE